MRCLFKKPSKWPRRMIPSWCVRRQQSGYDTKNMSGEVSYIIYRCFILDTWLQMARKGIGASIPKRCKYSSRQQMSQVMGSSFLGCNSVSAFSGTSLPKIISHEQWKTVFFFFLGDLRDNTTLWSGNYYGPLLLTNDRYLYNAKYCEFRPNVNSV